MLVRNIRGKNAAEGKYVTENDSNRSSIKTEVEHQDNSEQEVGDKLSDADVAYEKEVPDEETNDDASEAVLVEEESFFVKKHINRLKSWK